jgi:hypothetical protein
VLYDLLRGDLYIYLEVSHPRGGRGSARTWRNHAQTALSLPQNVGGRLLRCWFQLLMWNSYKNGKRRAKCILELRSTRKGIGIVTWEKIDSSAIPAHFCNTRIHYFTFHPKSGTLIKTVIRHLSVNTPAEDVSSGLEEVCLMVISVKQVTAILPPMREETAN